MFKKIKSFGNIHLKDISKIKPVSKGRRGLIEILRHLVDCHDEIDRLNSLVPEEHRSSKRPDLKPGDKVAIRIVNESLGVPVTDWRAIVDEVSEKKVCVKWRGGAKGKGNWKTMVLPRECVYPVNDSLPPRSQVAADSIAAFLTKGEVG